MQDSRNQHRSGYLAVEDYVAPVLHPAQARTNIITSATEPWVFSESLATGVQFVQITQRLIFAPHAQSVIRDICQVAAGADGKA